MHENHWFCLIFHHWWTDQCTKIFSTLDAGPSYSIQNPLIDSDCCDKEQPRDFLGQWIKISLKCPNVSPCFPCGELDFGVGSTQKLLWIILLGSPSIPSQTQFDQISRKTSFLIHGSTCVGVMLDRELISLKVGLCSSNFAQRRETASGTLATFDIECRTFDIGILRYWNCSVTKWPSISRYDM